MNKRKYYLFWACLFVTLSCSNLSNFCRHGLNRANGFAYTQPAKRNVAASRFIYATSTDDIKPARETTATATEINWDMLGDVTFRKKWNEEYKMAILYPVFGSSVKKLNRKELSITGYMIPLDIDQGLYAVSRNPYAACFFCGQSGPESVVSLKFKTKPRRFRTDEYLTMEGTMELNDTNVNDFIYIFRDTEEVK